ncbi:MAG: hypothetical protein ACPG45_10735 [Flavobacteriaceae bacterium]
MTNLQKVVLFIVTTGILFATISKIGIIAMLMLSAFFLLLALMLFLVWAIRPLATHRNNLQTFNLTFESKRIEFEALPNGLYQVNLCTLTFDEITAKNARYEVIRNAGGSTTLSWHSLPKKMQRAYFTKDITVQLSEKLLTEKQALRLHFELLKMAKTQSVANATYICNLIESVGKPKLFTASRLAMFSEAKQNMQARIQAKKASFAPPPPLSSAGAGAGLAQNSLLYVFLFAFNATKIEIEATAKEAMLLMPNETLATNFKLIALILVVLKCITSFQSYCKNECVS